MKLIDVTNSYPDLVNNQLENTDANYIRVYTLGKTSVIYSEASTHHEIVIVNKQRNVKKAEIEFVLDRLVKEDIDRDTMGVINLADMVEISIPILSSVSGEDTA